eukprot:3059269-Prymnesium_polylepis.1
MRPRVPSGNKKPGQPAQTPAEEKDLWLDHSLVPRPRQGLPTFGELREQLTRPRARLCPARDRSVR